MSTQDLRFAASHEWIDDGDPMTIGISQFAQDQLGDVVFVELPQVGATFNAGETFGSVESVKTVSDLYAPIDIKVVEVNTALTNAPELVNSDPYGDGWLLKVTGNSADRDNLMDLSTYEATAAH
jgi:glycine cleavage system H protein